MAAAGNGWITAVVSKGKMTLAFSLLLVLLVELPHKGDSSIPVVKSKTPSAEECRPHVEKAVDQYFGSKTRDQSATKDDSTTQIQTPPTDTEDEDDDDESKDDANPSITTANKDQEENGDEDDDDDEDESEDLVEKDSRDDDAKLRKEHIDDSTGPVVDDGDEDEDDDDDDDDDEDDEDEEDDDSVVNQTVKLDANVVDDDDDEDEDEDEDEINELNENLDEDEDDDDDTDNDVVTKDNITKASDHRTVDNMKHQHREARSTKVETEDDDDEEAEENEEEKTEDEEDDDDEEEDEDTDKDEETDDEEDEREDDKEEKNKPVPTIPKLQPKLDEQKFTTTIPKIQKIPDEKKPTTNIPKIQIGRSVPLEKEKEEKEKEKATGGPDHTPTRVVQELPRAQPPTEQPQTQEVPEKAQTVIKSPAGGTNQTQEAIKATPITEHEDDDDDDEEDEDDDLIENIYEEEDDEDDDDSAGLSFRSRVHVDAILNLDHIGTEYDQDEEKLALPIYRDIKKIHAASIKPMEVLYKYTDSTSRLLGDAEIFNKPMILFIGPWSTGKTAIINYLLGIERTPAAFKTGTGITDVDFTVITHGDRRQTISGTELTVDWKYASLQRFGQAFLDHFKAATVPHTLLKKINIVDTPGILENRKNVERGYPFNDVFQWFIDRADAIYVVLEPTKIDVGAELGAVVDQLKGRDVRFILNKADTIRRSDLMRVVGQLFWNLSPLMGSSEAPVIYAVSLSSKPFNPTAPAKFLADQENNFLYDLKDTMEKRVENRILYARRHAVRVRNHAKMVDCYLATYYRHKSIFSNKKNVAKQIVENPADYHIYEGLGNLSNVSRYDIPDESTYKNFFRLHPLYDFRPLASTCSYFRGCPMDKLDAAISSELPELLSKYKKVKSASSSHVKQVGR